MGKKERLSSDWLYNKYNNNTEDKESKSGRLSGDYLYNKYSNKTEKTQPAQNTQPATQSVAQPTVQPTALQQRLASNMLSANNRASMQLKNAVNSSLRQQAFNFDTPSASLKQGASPEDYFDTPSKTIIKTEKPDVDRVKVKEEEINPLATMNFADMTPEQKAQLKKEYESLDAGNVAQRLWNQGIRNQIKEQGGKIPEDYPDYTKAYNEKQQLSKNYNLIKSEEAHDKLLANGMTEEELREIYHSTLTQDETDALFAQGMTEDEVIEYSNDLADRSMKAHDKLYNLLYELKDNDVSYDDYIHMLQDYYDNPAIAESAKESPVANSIFSVVTNPVESVAAVGSNVIDYVTGKPIRRNDTWTDITRQTVNEQIENPVGRFFYNTGLSAADSAYAQAAGLAIGGGAGKFVGAGLQGFEKGSQVMNDAVDKGLTPNRIMLQGVSSGLTTFLSELIPMGKLSNIAENGLSKYTAKELAKVIGAQMVTEGAQEGVEDVFDWIADGLVAWDKSDINLSIAKYMDEGDSHDMAVLKTIRDKGLELAQDVLGGALSAPFIGGGAAGYAYAQGKYSSAPSVQTDVVMNSTHAKEALAETVKNIDSTNVSEEMAQRIEYAKELANKPVEELSAEDVVDMANVAQEQANETNNIAQSINEINYQANIENNLREYEETGSIQQKEDELPVERLARERAESIVVEAEKEQQRAYEQKQKQLLEDLKKDAKPVEDFKMTENIQNSLEEASEAFENDAAAKTFVENYNGSNLALYTEASYLAYRAGESGQNFDKFLQNAFIADLMVKQGGVDKAYLKNLYYNGLNARTTEESDINLRKNENRGFATGLVEGDKLAEFKKALAKKFNIEVFTDRYDAKMRGDFSANLARLTVNATSDNEYAAIVHEMFEFARVYNPKGMETAEKALVNMIVERTNEAKFVDAVLRYREAYRKAGREAAEGSSLRSEANKSFSEAQEEFINDAISYIFSTDEGMKTLVDYIMSDEKTTQKEKVSAIQAIKDWVDKLITSIKDFISGHKTNNLGYNYAKDANFKTKELESLSRMLTGVLDTAKENLAAMSEEKTTAKENLAAMSEENITENAENSEKVAHSLQITQNLTTEEHNLILDELFYKENANNKTTFKTKDGNIGVRNNRSIYIVDKMNDTDDPYRLVRIYDVDVSEISEEVTNTSLILAEIEENEKEGKGITNNISSACFALCGLNGPRESIRYYDFENMRRNTEYHIGKAGNTLSTPIKSNRNVRNRRRNFDQRPSYQRFSLSVDSDGRKLTKGQQEYFKDSKVLDEDGNLLRVYHGSMADFTIFDLGEARDSEDIQAFFFSGDKEEASGYGNRRDFYLNITNPADYDTAYNIFFKERKENPSYAGARTRARLIELGYDGVIANDGDSPQYTEYLAFYPEQIKLVSNTKPTKNEDIRFSLAVDSEGRELTAGQKKYFKDSKIVDENGNLKVMYHGTDSAGFTVFERSDDGISFFFTDNKKVASTYSRVDYFENPDKPMSFEELSDAVESVTNGSFREEKGKIIFEDYDGSTKTFKSIKDAQNWLIDEHIAPMTAQGMGSPSNYEVYLNAKNPLVVDANGSEWNDLPAQSWNKHYGDVDITYSDGTYEVEYMDGETFEWHHDVFDSKKALENKFGKIPELNGFSTAFLSDIYLDKKNQRVPTTTREYADYAYNNGYDSVIFNDIVDNGVYTDNNIESQVVVVFNPNQIKSIHNENPTENEDIRYSLAINSEGKELTKGQQRYFKNSKVRDAEGRLKIMYHGTENATFTIFDLFKMDDKSSIFLTDNSLVAETYAGTYNTVNPDKVRDLNQFDNAKDYLADFEYDLQKTDDGYTIYTTDGLKYLSDDTLEGLMDQFAHEIDSSNINAGIYETYVNIENPLEIDAEGRDWDEINYEVDGKTLETTREIAAYAKEKGYDGVIIKNVYDEGPYNEHVFDRGTSEIAIAFNPNQVKSIHNENPTENEDIRYSIAVDSDGNELTAGQQSFFRNSKMRDAEGRLKVMYHGTERGGFTVFDAGFSDDGLSLFFTDDADIASAYSGSKEEYKPLRTVKDMKELIHDSYTDIVKDGDTYKVVYDGKVEFEGNFEALKEYVEEQYGVTKGLNYKVYLNTENPLIVDCEGRNWDELPEIAEGVQTTRDYAAYAYENGYDSVIFNDIYDSGVHATGNTKYKNTQVVVVFDSNQVKSVYNENPTEDSDIRHSIDVDAFMDAFEAVDNDVKLNENELHELIKNRMDLESDVSKKMISEVASNIKKLYNSGIDKKTLERDLTTVFRYLKNTARYSMDDVMTVMTDIAKPILENVKVASPEQEKLYKDFTDFVKGYTIALNNEQMQEVRNEFGSYTNFKRMMAGKMKLDKNGTMLDDVWTEISDRSNGKLSFGTNPNDQPVELARYIMSLNPTYQNLQGQSLDATATDLALEIFRQFYVQQSMTDAAVKVKDEMSRRSQAMKERYQGVYNAAVKQVEYEKALNMKRLAEEIDNLTAEEQEAIRNGDTVNQALIQNIKNEYQKRYDRLQAESVEKIAKAKANYQNAYINKNLRRERSELKNRLLREVKALQNIIAHPQEGATKHVPINLIKPTIEMLEAINLDNGGANKTIVERLKKMSEVYESFKNNEAYSFDYDERIAHNIEELRQMFENKSYADLSITELERVIEIVTALKTQIKNANNLILQGRLEDAKKAADNAMERVEGSRRYDNGFTDALNRYGNIHLNAYREFRKLSGYKDGSLMDIYRDLDEGSHREMQIQKELGEIFKDVLEGNENQKEVKKFISTKPKDLVDIGITDKNGKPILITRAMRMSLIMHSMNAGNMRHILGSGITVPNMEYFAKGKLDEAYAKGTNYRFVDYNELLQAIQKNDTNKVNELTTAAQKRIEEMKKDLSPWEQRFLADAEEMFHEKTGKIINDVSMKLKGYALARVKNYFPIKTDPHFTQKEWSGLVQDGSLEGSGFLKERVISTKPILLEDITNVVERQTKSVAKYGGFAIPVRNFETIMKQTKRNQSTGQLRNLAETIDNVWGASDTKWLRNLMQDIQGGRREAESPIATLLTKLRGNYTAAVLNNNFSVAMKQFASYPTAAAVTGWKPLIKNIPNILTKGFRGKGIAELEAINPLLWYRMQGYGSQDLADAKSSDITKKLPPRLQKALGWTQLVDTGTVRSLEYAAKIYVDDNFKNLEQGSEEYWQKVSDVFTSIVEETQPNYSKLHQADVIRNPNALNKFMVMFKTQPMQNFGIVYDAMGELHAATISNNPEWKQRAVSKAAKAISSQVVSASVFSAMTILANILLHRTDRYKDEDGEWDFLKILREFGLGVVSCFVGGFILGTVIYEAASYFLQKLTQKKGANFYGLEMSALEVVNDLVKNSGKAISAASSLTTQKTSAGKEEATKKSLDSLMTLAETAGQYFGIPVANFKKIMLSMVYYSMDAVEGVQNGDFKVSADRDLFDNWEVESQYRRIFEASLEGDTEKVEKLTQQLVKQMKSENKDALKSGEMTEEAIIESVQNDIATKIKGLIKDDFLEGDISEEEAERYLAETTGQSEDDAYMQLKRWEGHNSSEYQYVKDVISEAAENPTPENRAKVIKESQGLIEHGKQPKDYVKSLKNTFSAEYKELYNIDKAADLNAMLRAALTAAGYTDAEAKEILESWLN